MPSSSHPRVYTTEAVVLRRSDFGEADRILTLFTPAYGKDAGDSQGGAPDDQPPVRASGALYADTAPAGHRARPGHRHPG